MDSFSAYKKDLESKNLHSESRSQRIKTFINDAEYIIFGPLFSPEKENQKHGIATGGKDDLRKSVIQSISKLGDKEEPPKDAKTGHGLKTMTPKQMIIRLRI